MTLENFQAGWIPDPGRVQDVIDERIARGEAVYASSYAAANPHEQLPGTWARMKAAGNNVTGGSASGALGVFNNSTGTVTINGTVTGGSAAGAYGATNNANGQLICNGPVVASSTCPAINDVVTAAGFIAINNGPIVNSTGINAVYASHLAVGPNVQWTIAKPGTPPAYSGTVTLGTVASSVSVVGEGYLGDYPANQSVRFSIYTRDAAGNFATLAGSPVVSIYKDGSTTETVVGVTVTADYDARTGYTHVVVVTTDTFYVTGSDYRAVITSGTVNGQSVTPTQVAHWSIQNRIVSAVTGLDTSKIDAAISSRLATGSYVPAPTAAQVRQEMDTNSSKLDVAVSTRTAGGTYADAPTPAAIRQEIDANSTKLDVAVSTRASAEDVQFSLVVPSDIAQALQTPLTMPVKNYCTLRRTIVMGTVTGASKIWFAIKQSICDSDADALVQIISDVGLVAAKGAALPIDPSLASITIVDATTGTINLFIHASITALLPVSEDKFHTLVWGAKDLIGQDTAEPLSGPLVVYGAVNKSIA